MKYEFVRCNSCGWQRAAHEVGTPLGELLAQHAETDCSQMRGIMLPMWSVAWPWYHTPDEEKQWGLEMAWRPVGTHSVRYYPVQSGADAKQWYLFPAVEVHAHDGS